MRLGMPGVRRSCCPSSHRFEGGFNVDTIWINMKVPCKREPPIFSIFSGPKNSEKSMFLVPVTIVEMFVSHVPRRMQILSSGDGVESHFRNVFLNFSTKF